MKSMLRLFIKEQNINLIFVGRDNCLVRLFILFIFKNFALAYVSFLQLQPNSFSFVKQISGMRGNTTMVYQSSLTFHKMHIESSGKCPTRSSATLRLGVHFLMVCPLPVIPSVLPSSTCPFFPLPCIFSDQMIFNPSQPSHSCLSIFLIQLSFLTTGKSYLSQEQ